MSQLSKAIAVAVPVAVSAALLVWWYKKHKSEHFVQVGKVSAMFMYPVKSCKCVEISEATCLQHGFPYDRNWVLLDRGHYLLSGAQHPTLLHVEVSVQDGKVLCLKAPGMEPLTVKWDLPDTEDFAEFRLYSLDTGGRYAGDEASTWFSKYLNEPGVKLYKIDGPRFITDNRTWGDKGKPGEKSGYGNASPYMVATEASLTALNETLPKPMSMKRFRPNIVISGTEAWAEDDWKEKKMKIGDVEFRRLKECGRCLFTTVDPETCQKDGNVEPLRTLRRTRLPADRDKRYGMDPFFGFYVVPQKGIGSVIRIGDPVLVAS